ncbi:VOC family protein [Candidatus Bathyarchaeota archaeon]|nr:VOC family protein [Candidatus Bathyarchaeota archaeon]
MNLDNTKIRVREITQIGLVVKDLMKSLENYWKTLGIGPWRIYTFAPPALREPMIRGKPVPYSMRLAVTEIGQIQYELIEPLEGPSVYKEFLASKGEGLHHIQSRLDDVTSELTEFKRIGINVLMSGKFRGGEFYYMDTEPILGTIYEIVKSRSTEIPADDIYPHQ